MTLESFIQAKLAERLHQREVLLFHDPDQIYLSVVQRMASDHVHVIEATGDLLEAREQCLEELQRVGADSTSKAGLVLYVTYAAPLDGREQYEDPFAMVGLAGASFPHGAGDSFKEICLQFLPEQAGKIEELFASGEQPGFALINSLRSGANDSAILRQLLDAEGPKEILANFLCADEAQAKQLKASTHWIKDFKDLVRRTLGLKLEGQKGELQDLQSSLWRYLLFSEFVFDQPTEVPSELRSVPHAEKAQEPFVKSLCQLMRDNIPMQALYEDAANRAAQELGLEVICKDVEDFGHLDTFSFEERGFLHRYARLAEGGQLELAAECISRRQHSFWVQRDVSRAAEWRLADLLLRLLIDVSALDSLHKQPLEELIAFYEMRFSGIDGLHREAEQVGAQLAPLVDPLDKVMALARARYHAAADKLARNFQAAVATEGWPAQGRPRAADIFDMLVEPRRKSGQKVAIFWVDALRFDLASALEGSLSARHKTKLSVACGQLPGITTIGMAALLPGASASFELTEESGKIIPVVGGRKIDSAKARAEALFSHIGTDRARVLDLDAVASGRLGANVDGLEVVAVKTTEIDALGENTPDYFLSLIPEILRKIELAVHQLADAGFQYVIITTDHGFGWMREAGAGDAVAKPAGDWVLSKDRCLLGSGSPDAHSQVFESRAVGIRTGLPLYVCPEGMATYTAGVTYFHGGVSPQEALIPIISAELRPAERNATVERVQINLTYRGMASGRVTSLVPSVELAYPASDFFGPPSVRLVLQGEDDKGTRVASPAASPAVDPTTGEIHLDRSKAIKVPLRIKEGFEGAIKVQAVDPSSGVAYATLQLTTDFHH